MAALFFGACVVLALVGIATADVRYAVAAIACWLVGWVCRRSR